jgi:acylphosphatase
MNSRAHVWITGRVQGVGYRSWTEVEARALGLSGWVRNLADGRVEAVFEGATGLVDLLLERCKAGPPAARVEAIDVVWEEVEHERAFHVVE